MEIFEKKTKIPTWHLEEREKIHFIARQKDITTWIGKREGRDENYQIKNLLLNQAWFTKDVFLFMTTNIEY